MEFLPPIDRAITRLAREVPRCRGVAFGLALYDLHSLIELRSDLRAARAVRRGERRRESSK